MERVCFLLRLKKECVDDYLKAHDPVWPEMLEAIHDAGIRNYSLFIQKDGMIVGYMEAENARESMARVGETDVSRRWEKSVAPYFEGDPGKESRGEPIWLRQYFYMP
ncbi:MAG TPA: L-rhamnose mutarotase [Phycisphaerae bacterium]|nr:L-rhamnose mutarotase [Phycisphaerae bacterium]